MTYRRRSDSDVWHFHHECQHWLVRTGLKFVERHSKPKSGELCDECRAKAKREKVS